MSPEPEAKLEPAPPPPGWDKWEADLQQLAPEGGPLDKGESLTSADTSTAGDTPTEGVSDCKEAAKAERQMARAQAVEARAAGDSGPAFFLALRRVAFGPRGILLLVLLVTLNGLAYSHGPLAVRAVGFMSCVLSLAWGYRWVEDECELIEWRREAAARRRYFLVAAPANVRCAFCHCDFFPAEDASQCKGCSSLVHDECASDLLLTPGPACPTYGCEGALDGPD